MRLPLRAPLAALALLASTVAARPAAACSCLPPPPPLDILRRSSSVFEGTITGLSLAGDYLYAEVQVGRRWKSPDVPTRIVATPSFGGGGCGLEYRVGQTWLFYAQSDCGIEVVSLCTYARRIADAAADLAALGAPLAPGATIVDAGVPGDVGLVDAGVCTDAGAPRLDFNPPTDLPPPPDDLASAPADQAAVSADLSQPGTDLSAARPDAAVIPGGNDAGCGCALGRQEAVPSTATSLLAAALLGLNLRRRRRASAPRRGLLSSPRLPSIND